MNGYRKERLLHICFIGIFFFTLYKPKKCRMRSLNEHIEIIRKCSGVLRSYFGVTSLRIFGSVARNEQKEDSDVDVCVDMKPNLFLHVELKKFLEEQLGCPVDVVRFHKNMNDFLRRQIEKDGILISL